MVMLSGRVCTSHPAIRYTSSTGSSARRSTPVKVASPTGRRHGRQVGSCHDAVGDDGVFCVV